jgi:ketosteroid isomerase-like protein
MATKRVDLVRRGIDYFNQHGVPDLEGLDPALEWWTPADLPDAGVRRGYEEVRDHLSSWFRSFDEFRVDPQEFVDGHDYVIVRLILTGRPKGSDAPVQQNDLVQLWRFNAETVVEVREYRTMQEALTEVGQQPLKG